MIRPPLLVLAAVVAFAAPSAAQTQTVIFPGQTGAQLLASIRAAYRPVTLLNYSGAQDRLMDTVDRSTVGGRDGAVCVYTSLFIPFDGQCSYGACSSGDANQDVFNGGSDINVEHTWPRSLLIGNPGPESDMHHLFPTQVAVNNDRGNLRFAEIPDAQTSRWYRSPPPFTQVTVQTTTPADDVDAYSELRSGVSFEPREAHQGDVARALFYMRAVWDTQTNTAFPFDAVDQRTLYDWHRIDAISASDQDRSGRVAQFQSGKDNPFVLDSTLVRRAFFPQITVDGEAGPDAAAARLVVAGANPFRGTARLTLSLAEAQPVRAEAFDALGRRVAVLFDGTAPAGELRLTLAGADLAPGVYAVRVVAGRDRLTQRLVRAQ